MSWYRRETGQAAVEFAFTSIFLLFIMAGILDLSRGVWYYNNLADAVRGGTRYAIVHGSDCGNSASWSLTACTAAGPTADDAAVTSQVRNQSYGMDPSGVTVTATWSNGNNNPGSPVEVVAVYNFTPILGAFLGGAVSIPIQAQSRMTIVY